MLYPTLSQRARKDGAPRTLESGCAFFISDVCRLTSLYVHRARGLGDPDVPVHSHDGYCVCARAQRERCEQLIVENLRPFRTIDPQLQPLDPDRRVAGGSHSERGGTGGAAGGAELGMDRARRRRRAIYRAIGIERHDCAAHAETTGVADEVVPAIQVDVAYIEVRGLQPGERIGNRGKEAASVIQPGLDATSPDISAETDQVNLAVIVQIGRHPGVGAFIAGGREGLLQGKTTRAIIDEDVHLRLAASRAAADSARLYPDAGRGVAGKVAGHTSGWHSGGICGNRKWHCDGDRSAEGAI